MQGKRAKGAGGLGKEGLVPLQMVMLGRRGGRGRGRTW